MSFLFKTLMKGGYVFKVGIVTKFKYQRKGNMEKSCPKCDEIIKDGKDFCPNCGSSLLHQRKKTGKPIAGGILIIIAATFCLVASIFVLIFRFYTSYYGYGSYSIYNWWMIIIVIFEIWGFSIGLAGGIYSIKRTHFPVAIIGSSFVIVAACLDFFGTLFLGIVILILGIIGTILIAVSKKEFIIT